MRGMTLLCVPMLALLGACSGLYYNTLEQFGIEKRDILVDRVEAARDAQEDARDQFASALERFSALTGYDGGELEAFYDDLNREFERSQARAQAVTTRINAVEEVSQDLFAEWEDELELYTNAELRRASGEALSRTRDRYDELIGAMREAEGRMAPVIDAFEDQVLFLRHNLNSQAVVSLRSELADIELETAALIRAMEESIAQANQFISQMGQT